MGMTGNTGIPKEALVAQFGDSVAELVDGVSKLTQMKFGTKAAEELGLPIFVSLNPLMVDGTGMCGCCRVTVDGKIFFACVDGPEFDGHKVNWDEFMSRLRQYKDEEKISMEKYEAEVGEPTWL